MKTRSGLRYLDQEWPEPEDYMHLVPKVQRYHQLLFRLQNMINTAEFGTVWDKRVASFVMAESALKYEYFFTDEEFQRIIDIVITKLHGANNNASIKWYILKLMTHSDYYKREARRKYIHSVIKCTILGQDIADNVVEFF